MEELKFIAKGMSQAGIVANGLAILIEFPLKEPQSTVLRLAFPSIQLQALIDALTQLQTALGEAPGSSQPH